MSLQSFVRLVRLGRGAALAALVVALSSPVPARAVVGGAPDQGPLSRQTVMVLNSRGGMCSAIVLTPDAILTAGHCVGGAVRVHYRGPEGGPPVLLEPASVTVHPGYDSGAVKGRRRSIDLALIRMGDPLPGAFAPASLSTSSPGKGSPVRLGGYGVLREGDARSTGTFRTADLAVVEPYGPGKILLWASGTGGAGACQGDSGGPMAGQDGAVAAVTSWASGSAKAACGSMSQGVLVAPQRAWIDRTLAGWGRSATWR